MARPTLRMVRNAVEERLERLRLQSSRGSAPLARDVYRLYQNAQVRRWETRGTSEGMEWKPYASAAYGRRKRRRYAAYPEAGRRMMIATATLFPIAVGTKRSARNPESEEGLVHRAAFTPRQLLVSVSGGYAKHADDERTYMLFGENFWKRVRERVRYYYLWGGN